MIKLMPVSLTRYENIGQNAQIEFNYILKVSHISKVIYNL